MSAEMSAARLVGPAVEELLARAEGQGIGADPVARALLDAALAIYKRSRSVEDIASELEFLAQNLDDDATHPFMRP